MESGESRGHAEVLRDELLFKDTIIALLRTQPRTIPEIAEALGCPCHEVVLWVMAMWRYGTLAEMGEADDDGYSLYALKKDAK